MTLASQFRGDIQAETLNKETAQPIPDIEPASLASQFAGGGLADTVGRNINAAQRTTPDQSLKVARLADQTGMPVDAVERNYDQILSQVKGRETDPIEIARKNPSLAKWLANPSNAALATNDLSILKRIEQLIPGEQAFVRLTDPLRQAESEAIRLPGTILAGTGSILDSATRTADRLLTPISMVPGQFDPAESGLLTTVDQFLQKHVGRPPDWLDPSARLRAIGEPIKEFAGEFAVPEDRRNIVTDISGAIGQLGAQVVQWLAAPQTLIPSLLAQGADIQAERAQQAGTTGTAESDTAVLAGAGVTALLEKVGIGQLLNRIPPQVKNGILQRMTDIAVAGGIEATQELVENISQNIITQQLTNPDQQIVDQDTWREITAAGGAGAFLRAVIQAATKGRDRQQAQAEQSALDSVVAAGDETWLKQNAPEKLQEFIAGAKKAGVDTVYVPVEQAATYFQSAGLDMAEAMAAAGVDRQDILAAQATGGDISIPLEIYAVALGEHHKAGLREFARLKPETPTPTEAQDAESMRQESDAILRRFLDSAQEPAGKVKEDVVGQLVAIGQDRQTAEAYGTLLDKAFTALGQRSGIDGFDLYSRYRLNINRENFDRQPVDISLDPYLDALRSGKLPTERQAFGPSFLEALREAGGIRDEGGELAGRDVARQAPGLVRETGMSADQVLSWAYENGYIDQPPTEYLDRFDPNAPTESAVYDLIDRELSGRKIYSERRENRALASFRRGAEQVSAELERAGLSLQESNEAIRRALQESQASTITLNQYTPDEIEFFRSMGIPVGPSRETQPRSELPAEGDRTITGRPPREGWTEATVVTGTDGRPAIIYRGSRDGTTNPGDFEQLGAATGHPSSALGVWFSADRGDAAKYGAVGEYNLDIRNPKTYNTDDAPTFDAPEQYAALRRELEASGHDGIVFDFRDVGGPVQMVAFEPDSVISKERVLFQSGEGRGKIAEVVSVGPATIKTTPVSSNLYREMSVDAISDLLISNYANSPYDVANFFVSDDKSLAIGQGENKGAFVTFRPWAVSVIENKKPGAGVVGGIEYKANAVARDAIDEIEIKKPFKLRNLANRFLLKNFEKTEETKSRVVYRRKAGLVLFQQKIDDATGLPLNEDGTVTLYHHTSRESAESIIQSGRLKSSAEPHVYVTTEKKANTGYGDSVVEVMIRPDLLEIDDEFPSGRVDYRISVGKPGGSVLVKAKDAGESSLFQEPEGVKRGQIKIGKTGLEISLFEKADLSTFIHESGHFFLEVMGDIATSPDAPQQIKDDYATALKWLGVESRDQIGVEQHEKWARGFESYVGEGKAPSPELRGLFSRFRTWMIAIYKSLRNLNVELTDEVRGVFDRMIATDEEIAAANNQIQTGEFQTKEEAGMTDKQWGAYQKLLTESRAEAEESLTARAFEEVRRERESWWKERLSEMATEVEAEANQMPVYQAWSFLADNKMPDGTPYAGALEHAKLDKSVLLSMYGQEFLNKNLRYKGVYQQEGGYHPSLVAEQFGFDSAQAMIERLASAPKKSEWVATEARRRMLDLYGDMLNDGTLPDQAMKAAHNDRRFKVIEAELTALGRLIGRAPPKVSEMRRLADNMIGSKKARDIQPYLYLRAERKAAKDYAELAAKGQRAQAYEAKQRQLLNGLLYDRAWKAKEEVEKIREYANGLMKKAKQEKLAKAGGSYLQQINDILSAYQFRKLPLKQVDRQEGLRAWVEKMQEEGDITAVPDEVIRRVEGQSTNYMNVTLDELRGVRDSLRNIDHLSNLKNKLLKKGEQRDKDEAREELLSRLAQSYADRKPMAPSDFVKGVAERLGDNLQSLADALWRPETIIEAMDGGESGPWHDYLWEPANDARAMQNEMREKVGKPLEELATTLDRKWQNSLHDEFEVAGRKMKRHSIIGMALNLGNDGNRQKLMQGGFWRGDERVPYSNADIETAISHLTEQDWNMVQTVWDTVNSLWPDIVAQQQRLSGLPPEKVEAVPFVVNTADGKTITMRGGYFPVAYDPRQSGAGEKQSADAAQAMLAGQYTRAATPKGHLKERTEYSAPILLDYNAVLTRHIDDVITDLSHREFLKQAQWIVADSKIKVNLIERIGESGYKALRAFIGHTVGADRPIAESSTKAWHRISDAILSNTAVYALGFRVITAWGNIPTGLAQAMARVKPKYVLRGFKEFYERHGEASALVHELSPFMRHKARDIDASYSEVMATLGGKNSVRRQIARASMQVHRTADYIVSHGVWYGRYLQAMDSGESVESAVALADKAVRQTQTAGAPKDLAGVERDPLFKMFRMFIGPMLIMNNRIRESVTKRGVIETWPEAFGTLVAAWFLPALLFELAVGRGPEDEEDPESWYLWAGTKLGLYPAQTIPLVRDMTALVEAKILGEYRQVRAAPIAEAGAAVIKAFDTVAGQISDAEEIGDIDTGKITKDTFRAIGPIVGLPTNQLDVTGSFVFDVMTGEYEPDSPLDYRYLLMRRPKEEQ